MTFYLFYFSNSLIIQTFKKCKIYNLSLISIPMDKETRISKSNSSKASIWDSFTSAFGYFCPRHHGIVTRLEQVYSCVPRSHAFCILLMLSDFSLMRLPRLIFNTFDILFSFFPSTVSFCVSDILFISWMEKNLLAILLFTDLCFIALSEISFS